MKTPFYNSYQIPYMRHNETLYGAMLLLNLEMRKTIRIIVRILRIEVMVTRLAKKLRK